MSTKNPRNAGLSVLWCFVVLGAEVYGGAAAAGLDFYVLGGLFQDSGDGLRGIRRLLDDGEGNILLREALLGSYSGGYAWH